jgi:hypothetical protein
MKSGTDSDAIEVDSPASKAIEPVSFTGLFRCVRSPLVESSLMKQCSFATRFELMLNFIGLVAACGAGASQVYHSNQPEVVMTDLLCNSH